MGKKDTRESFIQKASEAHNGRYSYIDTDYVNSKTKVTITCPIHGNYEQTPNSHLSGAGCAECYKEGLIGTRVTISARSAEDTETKCREVHGDLYTYDWTDYVNSKSIIEITCKEHGTFFQRVNDHISGKGCSTCAVRRNASSLRSDTESFIEKAKLVHGDKYDYSLVNYTGAKGKVDIICNDHGVFSQTANDHLNGCGCRHCRTDSVGWTDDKWVAQAESSLNFTGFKLYVVKLWDGEETFYKIGKTFVDIHLRFKEIAKYYSYQVCKVIEGDGLTISKLERKYQHINKEFRYSPKIDFNGHTECFSKVEVEDTIYGS